LPSSSANILLAATAAAASRVALLLKLKQKAAVAAVLWPTTLRPPDFVSFLLSYKLNNCWLCAHGERERRRLRDFYLPFFARVVPTKWKRKLHRRKLGFKAGRRTLKQSTFN
jgi:hypothetical protein